MVFKINLGACLVFILASLAISQTGPPATRLQSFKPSDFALLAFLWSPAFLWAGGAWASRQRFVSSIVWLVVSIQLMGAELYACYLEIEKAREEAITHEYTQSILAFLVILGEWAIGLPLLFVLAVVWRINRFVDYEE